MNYSIKDILDAAIRLQDFRALIQPVVSRLNNDAQPYIADGYRMLFDFDNKDCITAYFPFIYNCCASPDEDYRCYFYDENGNKTSGFAHFFGRNNEHSVKSCSFYVSAKIDQILEEMTNDNMPLTEDSLYSKLCQMFACSI